MNRVRRLNFEQPKSAPYPFSNDRWNRNVVQSLELRLQRQKKVARGLVALFVGSGGLPDILRMLGGYSHVKLVDLHKGLSEFTKQRVDALPNYKTWDEYDKAVEEHCKDIFDVDIGDFHRQVRVAKRSGLRGDFNTTKKVAEQIELSTYDGNIRELALEIGAAAVASGLEFGFVNVTNVALDLARGRGLGPIRYHRRKGMQVLSQTVLHEIPLAENAVVADSSRMLTPRLYSGEEYLQLAT